MSVATIDRTSVFEKTAQGRAAIGHRLAGMGALYRRVLIVIDGRRNIESVASLFSSSDIAAVTETLWREGFIRLAGADSRAATMDVDAGALGQAKVIMVDSAKACIGLLAERLITRIGTAQTLDELAIVAGQWHMALRDSKRGKSQADALLERVRRLLSEASAPLPA